MLAVLNLVADTGFEPVKAMPADLQSAPVGRLGNLPCPRLACTSVYLTSTFLFLRIGALPVLGGQARARVIW